VRILGIGMVVKERPAVKDSFWHYSLSSLKIPDFRALSGFGPTPGSGDPPSAPYALSALKSFVGTGWQR
jgi:hypothetical protein